MKFYRFKDVLINLSRTCSVGKYGSLQIHIVCIDVHHTINYNTEQERDQAFEEYYKFIQNLNGGGR